MIISKDISIEDLVSRLPQAVNVLRENGLACIVCGEPVWGTLEEFAKQKGFSDDDIAILLDKLNALG